MGQFSVKKFNCLNKYSILLVNNKYKTILEPNKNYTSRKPFFKSGKENYRTKNNVWKDKKMTLFTLRNIIRNIREKTYHDLIKNVSNHGYKMVIE